MIHKSLVGAPPPVSFERYYEYMGGLGDVILRLGSSPWYASLDRLAPNERAAVVLMCHNPNVAQLFEWHPKISQIEVYDFGFGGHAAHPWEDPVWRAAHQMPAKDPCPPPHDGSQINFYPAPSEVPVIAGFASDSFIVVCPTAGSVERTFPVHVADEIVDIAISSGFPVVEIGASYYLSRQHGPLRPRAGLCSLVDKLSVPGTIELIRKARGLVTAHSFTCLAAWQLRKPVFLLYPKWTRDVFDKHGVIGYFFGANDPGTVHAEFSAYNRDLFRAWVQS